MKGMFLKKFDIYYQKCATVAERFQLSMTKLGACDEIRWNDGTQQTDQCTQQTDIITLPSQRVFFTISVFLIDK